MIKNQLLLLPPELRGTINKRFFGYTLSHLPYSVTTPNVDRQLDHKLKPANHISNRRYKQGKLEATSA